MGPTMGPISHVREGNIAPGASKNFSKSKTSTTLVGPKGGIGLFTQSSCFVLVIWVWWGMREVWVLKINNNWVLEGCYGFYEGFIFGKLLYKSHHYQAKKVLWQENALIYHLN